MNKLPMTELDTHFQICAWCDDSRNITKGMIALEDVREFEAKRREVQDYVRKFVSHGICNSCKDEVTKAIYDYAPKK